MRGEHVGAMQGDGRKVVAAEELSGQDIGRDVTFIWRWMPSKIVVTITAELRQIYHVGGHTTISVIGEDKDDVPGEIEEFTMVGGAALAVHRG